MPDNRKRDRSPRRRSPTRGPRRRSPTRRSPTRGPRRRSPTRRSPTPKPRGQSRKEIAEESMKKSTQFSKQVFRFWIFNTGVLILHFQYRFFDSEFPKQVFWYPFNTGFLAQRRKSRVWISNTGCFDFDSFSMGLRKQIENEFRWGYYICYSLYFLPQPFFVRYNLIRSIVGIYTWWVFIQLF